MSERGNRLIYADPATIGEDFGLSSDADAQRRIWCKRLGEWYQSHFAPLHENLIKSVVFHDADSEVVIALQRGGRIRDDGARIMLTGDAVGTPESAALIVEMALARGLTEVTVRGSAEFRRELARQCWLNGITVTNLNNAMRGDLEAMQARGMQSKLAPTTPTETSGADPRRDAEKYKQDAHSDILLRHTAAAVVAARALAVDRQGVGDLDGVEKAQESARAADQQHRRALELAEARAGKESLLSPEVFSDDAMKVWTQSSPSYLVDKYFVKLDALDEALATGRGVKEIRGELKDIAAMLASDPAAHGLVEMRDLTASVSTYVKAAAVDAAQEARAAEAPQMHA